MKIVKTERKLYHKVGLTMGTLGLVASILGSTVILPLNGAKIPNKHNLSKTTRKTGKWTTLLRRQQPVEDVVNDSADSPIETSGPLFGFSNKQYFTYSDHKNPEDWIWVAMNKDDLGVPPPEEMTTWLASTKEVIHPVVAATTEGTDSEASWLIDENIKFLRECKEYLNDKLLVPPYFPDELGLLNFPQLGMLLLRNSLWFREFVCELPWLLLDIFPQLLYNYGHHTVEEDATYMIKMLLSNHRIPIKFAFIDIQDDQMTCLSNNRSDRAICLKKKPFRKTIDTLDGGCDVLAELRRATKKFELPTTMVILQARVIMDDDYFVYATDSDVDNPVYEISRRVKLPSLPTYLNRPVKKVEAIFVDKKAVKPLVKLKEKRGSLFDKMTDPDALFLKDAEYFDFYLGDLLMKR